MSNCRNCGAPPDGSGRCPYCGTASNERREGGSSYIEITAGGIRIGVLPPDPGHTIDRRPAMLPRD